MDVGSDLVAAGNGVGGFHVILSDWPIGDGVIEMASYIIGGLIFLYAGGVIVHKIQNYRKGNYCCGGCSGCSKACGKKGEDHENNR